jgi:hypothetical protein
VLKDQVGVPATRFLHKSVAMANDTRRYAPVATTGVFPSPPWGNGR